LGDLRKEEATPIIEVEVKIEEAVDLEEDQIEETSEEAIKTKIEVVDFKVKEIGSKTTIKVMDITKEIRASTSQYVQILFLRRDVPMATTVKCSTLRMSSKT